MKKSKTTATTGGGGFDLDICGSAIEWCERGTPRESEMGRGKGDFSPISLSLERGEGGGDGWDCN